jgi:hypothetical protein
LCFLDLDENRNFEGETLVDFDTFEIPNIFA